MTELAEAPFSANFHLYGRDGMRVQFTVRSNSNPTGHIALVTEYLEAAEAAGYAATLPGLEAGEEVEEIDAFVRGETSRGDACVYLYHTNQALKWKIATVYVERLHELPFDWKRSKLWPGSAPERDVATSKGYLVDVEPFEIVMEPTGKVSESGNEIMRFARVREGASQQTKAEPSAAPEDNSADPEPENIAVAREQGVKLARAKSGGVIVGVLKATMRYQHEKAAKNAVAKVGKALGFDGIPGDDDGADDRELLYTATVSYADLRDADMDDDEALQMIVDKYSKKVVAA